MGAKSVSIVLYTSDVFQVSFVSLFVIFFSIQSDYWLIDTRRCVTSIGSARSYSRIRRPSIFWFNCFFVFEQIANFVSNRMLHAMIAIELQTNDVESHCVHTSLHLDASMTTNERIWMRFSIGNNRYTLITAQTSFVAVEARSQTEQQQVKKQLEVFEYFKNELVYFSLHREETTTTMITMSVTTLSNLEAISQVAIRWQTNHERRDVLPPLSIDYRR